MCLFVPSSFLLFFSTTDRVFVSFLFLFFPTPPVDGFLPRRKKRTSTSQVVCLSFPFSYVCYSYLPGTRVGERLLANACVPSSPCLLLLPLPLSFPASALPQYSRTQSSRPRRVAKDEADGCGGRPLTFLHILPSFLVYLPEATLQARKRPSVTAVQYSIVQYSHTSARMRQMGRPN
ncbi:hypothetical protein LY76DRAFT_333751 [Colletotrichum caudatum]|nr:hypothetical protein LY76DRAFT_333751 [Colletotrichum caudatum]